MRFLDEAKVFFKSGNGGNGIVSFKHEKNIEYGGPDGGNGGNGGDIILETDSNLTTLIFFRYKQHFKAQNGLHGKGSNKTGKSGDSLVIKIPIGTQLFVENILLYDFTYNNEQYLVAKGGKGGLGNAHFKTSINQSPRYCSKGYSGEEICITLKLKLLSDVGLIGLPNSGKSTFLSKVTAAKPKIANYPFTTLTPKLGVVYNYGKEFVLAEIPGLIEGAHSGHGLGDRFLKHVERCNILIHMLDVTSVDLVKDYFIIRNELLMYSKNLQIVNLVTKKEIICLNKCDLISEKQLLAQKKLLYKVTKNIIFTVSSTTKHGINDLLYNVYQNLKI